MPKLDPTLNVQTINMSSVVRRIEGAFSANVGADLVIFDHNRGAYYGSGPVGESIWALLEHETTVGTVCDALTEQFDVDRATCEAETLEFIAQLHDKGLLSAS